MRQALLPVERQQLALRGDLVDVARERQRHHVRGQSVDDGARLAAGAAVRLADAHILAGGLLPVLREGDVDVFVELARRIVGRVEQRHFARGPLPQEPSNRTRTQRARRRGFCLSTWPGPSDERERRLAALPQRIRPGCVARQRAAASAAACSRSSGNRGGFPVARAQPRARGSTAYLPARRRARPAGRRRRRRCRATARRRG